MRAIRDLLLKMPIFLRNWPSEFKNQKLAVADDRIEMEKATPARGGSVPDNNPAFSRDTQTARLDR
jgi:hypothetical protein